MTKNNDKNTVITQESDGPLNTW